MLAKVPRQLLLRYSVDCLGRTKVGCHASVQHVSCAYRTYGGTYVCTTACTNGLESLACLEGLEGLDSLEMGTEGAL